jgi:hypothetical protein
VICNMRTDPCRIGRMQEAKKKPYSRKRMPNANESHYLHAPHSRDR